jgi:hypothetical protein
MREIQELTIDQTLTRENLMIPMNIIDPSTGLINTAGQIILTITGQNPKQ